MDVNNISPSLRQSRPPSLRDNSQNCRGNLGRRTTRLLRPPLADSQRRVTRLLRRYACQPIVCSFAPLWEQDLIQSRFNETNYNNIQDAKSDAMPCAS